MTLTFPIPADRPLGDLAGLDITDGRFKASPHAFYARLRGEAPAFPVRALRGQRAWLVTRYDDVLRLMKDDRNFVKDRRNAMTPAQLNAAPKMPPLLGSLQRNLLGLDGKDHDRLKVLVHQAFTPRTVERMHEQTRIVADRALDAALRRGRIDLIADFALPVPLTIIARILGVPEADHHRFGKWTQALFSIADTRNPLRLVPSVLAFLGYLRRLIRARRARPQDDLISGLVGAQEATDHFSNDEVLAMIVLLLTAGHETTVNLIGSGVHALLGHPDQLERLRADPDLMKPAVEELARFVTPAEMATERYAVQDSTFGGVTVPRGELVLGVIAAANRDPAQFEHPDTLELGRANNRHLSFGQGMHYCLGAPLSRMEASIALNTLLARAPDLRLAVPEHTLRWRSSLLLRGLETLPVTL